MPTTHNPDTAELREVAEARLKQEAELFKSKQKAEKEAIAARDAKAKADAIAVAEAEAIDAERKLIGAWRRRFNFDDQYVPGDCSDEELEARRIELGIPMEALRCDDGSIGFGATICNLWAKKEESHAIQVESERAAERQAALDRAVARQLEWEANHAAQQRLEA